ncbi:MAG: hydroxyphenylacetyl-CoA thioesterase PaaI [Geminicoccaceae bacterium]
MADEPRAPGLAEAVKQGMYARDHAAQTLGITVDEVEEGFARCRMSVRGDMINGHGTCHGGLIFALADTAFAYACNACNRTTVALGGQITFVAPARAGDELSATARERSRSGRTGVYDVEVGRADGTTVALFRGNAYETRGEVVATPERARAAERRGAGE